MRRRDALKLLLSVPATATLARAEQAPTLRVQRLSWAGVKLVAGGSTLFIDASYDPSSAGTPKPDVPLTVDTRDRNALITHHHGDHFDAAALRTVLGENGILVVPESVAPTCAAGIATTSVEKWVVVATTCVASRTDVGRGSY